MRSSDMSLSRITSYISPSVPFSLVKPTAAASFIEDEPSRNPTFTRIPVPSSDSRRFWAWAGPCEDQPMTPICLMPSKALGSFGKRWRPPATMVSSRSAILTTRGSNTFEVKLIAGPPECARIGCGGGLARSRTRRQHGERCLGNVLRLNAHYGFELRGEPDVDPGSAQSGDPTAGRLCRRGRYLGPEAGGLHRL